ncbi:hypothetical protein ACP70R_036688 [Stipagrostis hirtigluma subsp. patula]
MASKDVVGLVFDIIGSLVPVVISCPPIPRVWGLRQMHDLGLARRCQWWLLALFLHSLTMILIILKEFLMLLKEQKQRDSLEIDHLHLASLLVRFPGPFFTLIVSTVLLASLVRRYPITQDVWMTRFVIAFGCIGYLAILLTDFICFEITITLEIILTPVTICMHVLRFASQGPLIQFNVVAFMFSAVGVIPGVLCLVPLGEEKFLEQLLHRLALKITTLVGAGFRLFDAMVIWFHTTREGVNYFRNRLMEFFL